jgi:hypothetical protein
MLRRLFIRRPEERCNFSPLGELRTFVRQPSVTVIVKLS